MRRFEYHEPRTLADAVALLTQFGETASVMAGGTDLLVEIREELRICGHVVNIKKIPGLATLSFDPNHGLRFGALVTAREIETSPIVRSKYPNLADAVSVLGSIQVRNRATIVGNICRASPSADMLPPLIADGATVAIWGEAGERSLQIEDFFLGPGKTALKPGEIVTGVSVPAPSSASGRAYIKHGRRKAMELATVGVAVTLEWRSDQCSEIRIALGAVAPVPMRAHKAEAVLRGQSFSNALLDRAAEAAMAEAKPISNVRASAAYRRDMVRVLTRRAIGQALGGLQ